MDSAAGEKKQLIAAIAKFRKAPPQILSFHDRLQKQLEIAAKAKGIPPDTFALMYQMRTPNPSSTEYYQLPHKVVQLLMNDYTMVKTEFEQSINYTKKASSLVENLNSRIQVYMNLKRVVPRNYFVLLKVYFNPKNIGEAENPSVRGKACWN